MTDHLQSPLGYSLTDSPPRRADKCSPQPVRVYLAITFWCLEMILATVLLGGAFENAKGVGTSCGLLLNWYPIATPALVVLGLGQFLVVRHTDPRNLPLDRPLLRLPLVLAFSPWVGFIVVLPALFTCCELLFPI